MLIFAPAVRDRGRRAPPIYIFYSLVMNRNDIISKMTDAAEKRGCFIVDATVGKDNDITLILEKDEGSVTLEDCEAVNDAFLAIFDKDAEDYSLTVTSAGLDQPFKVLRQYTKAIGSQVEVSLRNGKRLTGVLTGADENGIDLRYSEKEAVEGRKRKVLVDRQGRFAMSDINSVVPHIVFEK